MFKNPDFEHGQMTDHAHRSKRSVHAMLKGYGDGTEKKYLRFHSHCKKQYPDMSDRDIVVAFEERKRLPFHENLDETLRELYGDLAANVIEATAFIGITLVCLIDLMK